jgi:uncharacterized secreted protein with C-terminal beta-propeller domain
VIVGELQNEGLVKKTLKPLCEAVKDDLKIRNRLRTMCLGTSLFEIVNLLQQLFIYAETIDKISKNFIIGNIEIENSEVQYTVIIGGSKIVTGYIAKSHILELKKVAEVGLLFVQLKEGCEDLDRVREEMKVTINENLSLLKENVIEVHYTLAEFIQKLILHYEEQLFSNLNS